MTKIEFLKAVAAGTITEEVIAKAEELVAADAKEKSAAVTKRAEKAAEKYGPLMDAAFELIGDSAETAKTASEVKDGMETSVQMASTILRKLVDAGRAEAIEKKVSGRKVKAYFKVIE